MDRFLEYFNRLKVGDAQLSTTKCLLDRDARLLSIYGWSQYLMRGKIIALTIVDETDRFEWTYMIKSVPYRTFADEPFQVKISLASTAHSFVVSTRVLRRIPNTNGQTADVDYYEVTSESSCTAKRSSTSVAGVASLPVLDVRPRLRSDVGIRGANDDMLSILTAGSLLPTEKAKSFICTGRDSVTLQIFQGDSRRVSDNKRVHSIELDFEPQEIEKTITLTLCVAEDGTLTTIVNELGYRDLNSTLAPRIIDVICPKITIDISDTQLRVEWTGTIVKKAALHISTTYSEIHRWRVSIAATGFATGSGGHLLLFPREGYSQCFNIPSNILEAGVRYEVTVEGLQDIDDRVADSFRNFRIICRKTTTLETIAVPARISIASSRMPSLQPDYPTAFGFSSKTSSTSQVNLALRIEIERSTYHQASVIISTNPQAALVNRKFRIRVNKIATTTGPVYNSRAQEFDTLATGVKHRFDFLLQFEAGSTYRVTVAAMEFSDGIYQSADKSIEQTADFRAELTLSDIKALHRKAKGHTSRYGSLPCEWLYRNKSPKYFQDIQLKDGGIMKVYNKDNSGDPASPINLQIKGLFFMASVDNRTGHLPTDSPFGSTRIHMNADDMLLMAPNLYFVDYYCMLGKAHYVTLVMTKPGSQTDSFCAERLMRLSVHDATENPFLFYDHRRQLKVSAAHYLWVELLFTEDIEICKGVVQQDIPTCGKGSSTPEGIPKKANCMQCNLSQYTGLQKF